jgi:hypothetical protein
MNQYKSDNITLFHEQQRITMWWFWLIMFCINAFFLYGLYKQLITGQPFGNNPASDTGLIFVTLFIILLTSFFLLTKLETKIKPDGLYVRLFPIHLRFRHFRWTEIHRAYIRQYSPIKEYGGWGVRYGLGGRGKAYNVSGNMGLQVEFIDKKKLLIGTHKPEEMELVLNNLGIL